MTCRRCGCPHSKVQWHDLTVCEDCACALDLWEYAQKSMIRRLVANRETLKLKITAAIQDLDAPLETKAAG